MNRSPSGWPIIGHQAAVEYLQRNYVRRAVSHAYLLVGPSQVGKTTLALAWAATLLCQHPRDLAAACGQCESCQRRQAGTHPDYHSVQPEAGASGASGPAGIGLEQILELQAKIFRRPVMSARTVAVIIDGHRLSAAAANALLKTFEEPRGQTTLVMTAEQVLQLPATLASRCQRLRLRGVPTAEIEAGLQNRGVPHSAAFDLAQTASGCPGRALSWVDDTAGYRRYLESFEQLQTAVAQPAYQRLQTGAAWLKNWDTTGGLSAADSLSRLLQVWTLAAREQMLASLGLSQLSAASSRPGFGGQTAWSWRVFLDELRLAQASVRAHVNPRLVFDTVLLALPTAPAEQASPL